VGRSATIHPVFDRSHAKGSQMTDHDHSLQQESARDRAYSGVRSRGALPSIHAEFAIVACSRCLRVQRGADWLIAEEVIREIRAYELPEAPRIRPGLCDRCRTAIRARRARVDGSLAA
jgi:hypothetical protein